MGQKVSPVGLRIGIIRDWDSRWYADKNDVADLLHEDLKIRGLLEELYVNSSVSRIEIERSKGRVILTVHTAKPGMVIGREGSVKKEVVEKLQQLTQKEVFLNVVEVKKPEIDAQLVAENIAKQLENRASFRRVQKMAIQRAMRAGAQGCKTLVSGRLGGAEMARSEGYSEGNVPLHTLRADIDYATAEAATTYGKLGIKVWIYKGEILPEKKEEGRTNVNTKRTKYRRPHRVSYEGPAKGGVNVSFGDFGLKSTQGAWVTNRQIEAARIAMTRYMKRQGKVWIRIFPHMAKTAKPLEVRMGSGKGSPDGFVAVVKEGTVMFEIGGVDEAIAREAFRLASHKLPVKTKFVKRESGDSSES